MNVLEGLDKLVLAGMGALSMTREKAEKIFDEYVKRGQAEKGSRSGFVQDLVDSADKARKDLEKLVAEQVDHALKALRLATAEDIRRLEEKIDRMTKREP